MRLLSCQLILLLSLSAPSALAQTQEMSPAPDPQTSEQAPESMASEDEEQAENLRSELKELLRSRRTIRASDGLSDGQVYGIATGIVAGAVGATLIGSGGLAMIAVAAGGGAIGNWFMAD